MLDVTPENLQIMPEFTTTFTEKEERRDSFRFSMSPDWRSRNVTIAESHMNQQGLQELKLLGEEMLRSVLEITLNLLERQRIGFC